MSKRRTNKAKQSSIDDDDDEDADGVSASVGADDPPSELDMALAGLGAVEDAKIIVNKLGPNGEARCKTYPPAEFTDEVLRAEFGAGTYYLYIREGGRLKAPGKIKLELAEMKGAPAPSASPVGEAASREGVPAAVRDLLTQQMQMFADLRGLVTQQAQGGVSAKQEMREMLLLCKELMPQPKADGGGGIDTFLKGLAMGQKLHGNGGGAGWADVLLKGLDMIGPDMLQKAAASAGMPMLPTATTNEPTEAAPIDAAANGGVDMLAIMKRLMAPQLERLLVAAARGSDPAAYAHVMLDQVPDQYISVLGAQLRRPDWWAVLLGLSPAVAQYQPWFSQLRDRLLAELEEAAGSAIATPGDGIPSPPAAGVPGTDAPGA